MAKAAVVSMPELGDSGDELLEVDAIATSEGVPLSAQMREGCGIELPPEPAAGDADPDEEEFEEKAEKIPKKSDSVEAEEEAETEATGRFESLPPVAGEDARRSGSLVVNGCGTAPGPATDYGDSQEAKVKTRGSGGARRKQACRIATVFPQPAAGARPAPERTREVSLSLVYSPAATSSASSAPTPTSSSASSTISSTSCPAKPVQAEAGTEASVAALTEHFDVLLLHSEDDWCHRKDFFKMAAFHGWKVTAQSEFHPQQTRFEAFGAALKCSTYTVLLLTEAFLRDCWCINNYQMALTQSVQAQSRSVIPVLCQKDLTVPLELSIYNVAKSWQPYYKDNLKKAINTQKRCQREKMAGLSPSPATTTDSGTSNHLAADSSGPTSLEDTLLRRRPELKPSESAARVLRDIVYRQLCLCLDRNNPLSRHWVLLAEKLGFRCNLIEGLRRERSPTAAVLDGYCEYELTAGRTPALIRAALRKALAECHRADCLEIMDSN